MLHQIWFDLGKGNSPSRPTTSIPCSKTRVWNISSGPCQRPETIVAKNPRLKSIWDRLPHGINKADFFRYIILFEFGGAYFDIDFCCVQNLQRLMIDDTVVLTEEWPFSLSHGTLHNGAMICKSPRHPFWNEVISEVLQRLDCLQPGDDKDIQKSVLKLTGTAMLRDVAIRYAARPRVCPILICPFGIFTPLVNYDQTYLDNYEQLKRQSAIKELRFPSNPDTAPHTFYVHSPSSQDMAIHFLKLIFCGRLRDSPAMSLRTSC